MSEEEKDDRFIEGLKHRKRVEVLKAHLKSFEDTARMALDIKGAIWSSAKREASDFGQPRDSEGPAPIKVGNVKGPRDPQTKA